MGTEKEDGRSSNEPLTFQMKRTLTVLDTILQETTQRSNKKKTSNLLPQVCIRCLLKNSNYLLT